MLVLTIPRAILMGLTLIAIAIGSIPFGMNLFDASATKAERMQVEICGWGYNIEDFLKPQDERVKRWNCAEIHGHKRLLVREN